MVSHLYFPVILIPSGALGSTLLNYLWVLPSEIFDAQKKFQPETKNAKKFLQPKVENRYRLPDNRKNTFLARKTHTLQSENFSGNTNLADLQN